MNRQDGAIVATAILWAGEIVAMLVLLTGTDYVIPALISLAGGGAVNTLIVPGGRGGTPEHPLKYSG